MTAPALQAHGTAVVSTGAAVAVAWPTHAAGDIGVLVVEGSGNSAVQAAPAGWTGLADLRDVSSTAGSRLRVYWKRAASSAEPNVTTYTTLDHQVARISTIRGAIATGDPFDDTASDVKVTASTTATLPSVTTTVAEVLVAFICGRPDDDASTTHFGTPVNVALTAIDAGSEAGTATGNGGGFVVASGVMATAGVTGTTTMTKSASTTDTRLTLAIKPPPIIIPPDPDPDPVPTPDPGPALPPSGARIGFAVGPWKGGKPTQQVTQFDSATITLNLQTGPSVRMGMLTNTPAAKVIDGLATDMWVTRKGVPWKRLRIMPVGQRWDDSANISIAAVGYKQVAGARKIVNGPPTFTQVDQGQIGWQLIDASQALPGGDLGITAGTVSTGQFRDRTEYQIGEQLGQILSDLGAVENGMWWGVDENLVYDALLWTDFPVRPDPIVRGQNALGVERTPGNGFANASGAIGSRESTQPTWAESTDITTDPRGRWEFFDATHSTVTDQSTVVSYARGNLADSSNPPGAWKIRLDPEWFFDKGSNYNEGDFVTIVVPTDIVDVPGAMRSVIAQITEVVLVVSADGGITVAAAAVELAGIADGPPPDPDPVPSLVSPPVLSVLGGVWNAGLAWNTTNGVWANTLSFSYQWQQSATGTGSWANASASAPGGNAATAVYAPPVADAGLYYSCLVTAHGPGGTASARSNVHQSIGPTPPPITTLVPPDGFCWWAAHTAQAGSNGNATTLGYTQWRSFARRYADALHFYKTSYNWDGTIPTEWATMANAHPDGTSILVINWKIASNMTRRQVANGGNDATIDTWCTNIVGWPHRLIIALDHEFDNNTRSTGNQNADHADMFRHVVLRARANGVDNVEFMWDPTGYSSNAGVNGLVYNQMWPGDDVVDWLAWDPYFQSPNRVDYARATSGASGKRSLISENVSNTNWSGMLTWAKTAKTVGVNGLAYPFGGKKPLALAEWGTWFDQMTDGEAASRIRSIGSQWADEPQMKMLIQYHNNAAHDNHIDTAGRTQSQDAFGDVGELPQFNYGIDNVP